MEIEAKIKSTETVTEDDAQAQAQADASLSPNSKFIKRHQEKMKRERTRSGLGGCKVGKEMERYEGFTYPGKNTNILLWKQHEGVLPPPLCTSPTGPTCLHIAQTCLDRPTCPTNDPYV